jgi:IS30 family transposase
MSKRTPFGHLDQYKRDRLACLVVEGHLQKDIAAILNVDPSTVSRERRRLKRRKTYDSESAQRNAEAKRRSSKWKGMRIEADNNLRRHIVAELKQHRSPDEIAGRMKKEKRKNRVGKDAIYEWLYSSRGQRYAQYLCTKRTKPKPHKPKPKREMIPNRIPLNKRPKTRGLVHAQGDTFVSPKRSTSTASVAAFCTEQEKLLVLCKLPNLQPAHMKDAAQKVTASINVDTYTLDNGIENRGHEAFGVPTYFCDPHSPWQKPHIENNIGLVRRWHLPKGTDLTDVTQEELDDIAAMINGKYRKSLGYRSALEVASARGIVKEKLVHQGGD